LAIPIAIQNQERGSEKGMSGKSVAALAFLPLLGRWFQWSLLRHPSPLADFASLNTFIDVAYCCHYLGVAAFNPRYKTLQASGSCKMHQFASAASSSTI